MHASPPNGAGGPARGADGEFERLVANVAARVRPACRGWSDVDFDALVHSIARTKLRWADAERRGGAPPH